MRRIAVALFLGTAAMPAWAQDDLAERKAVAADYIALSMETIDIGTLAVQVAGMVLAQIQQQQPQVYAEKADRLNDMVTAAMEKSIRDGMIGLDDDMAKAFTLQELTGVRDFYASPEGRSVMSKMPAFMAEAMPRVMQQSLATGGALMQDLKDEGVDVR